MSTSNGSTNGTHSASSTDADLDALYSWMPGLTPAPAPCPEALFSLTLKGSVGGVDALLTVRGMTAAEFTANLQHVKGLLDPTAPAPTASSTGQGEGWCAIHQVPMKLNHGKNGKPDWYSHRTRELQWCKGK